MIGLTHRQRDCHLIIQDLIDAGVPPTLRAVAHDLGVEITTARLLINALIERGWLVRDGWLPSSPLKILIRLQPVPDFQFTITPAGQKAIAP